MQNQSVTPANVEEINPLAPPPELSTEERWIVRIHGKDMGPFSSQSLYPKLLRGDIDPDTLLLDQNRFSRCRLSEVDEFQPYLDLHNTQNPILLEEQRQQEKEKEWEETGRTRMIIAVSSVVALIIAGFFVWRFFIYQPEDVYLSDDGQKIAISLGSFKAATLKKKKVYNWKDQVYRRRGGKRGKKGSKSAGPGAQAIDFSKGGGSGIPRAQLNSIITSKIRNVYSCFLAQMQRDGNFSGGTVMFRVNGNLGRVTKVNMEDGGSRVLVRCIQRNASGWGFPKFQGNAEIYIPVRLQRRRRY